jgi:phosphoribosylaminoimidazole-succinocarboxamide synthase
MARSLENLDLVASGKVREVYETGDDLLMVASDRISIYDVIMPNTIPDKGRVLTGMSAFWFDRTSSIVPNHMISIEDVPDEVRGRAMLVRRLEMYPVECVVRGYLSGSGWREYCETGAVCGVGLPEGLKESDRLPRPIFTPATKAEFGDHDGAEVILGDEVLTPDSSRYWPADLYEPGHSQPSFDKQFVRDWADAAGWDHSPPAPELPEEVVAQTRDRYLEAYERITGEELDR